MKKSFYLNESKKMKKSFYLNGRRASVDFGVDVGVVLTVLGDRTFKSERRFVAGQFSLKMQSVR